MVACLSPKAVKHKSLKILTIYGVLMRWYVLSPLKSTYIPLLVHTYIPTCVCKCVCVCVCVCVWWANQI